MHNRFRVCLKRIDSAVLHAPFRSGRGNSVELIAVLEVIFDFDFDFDFLVYRKTIGKAPSRKKGYELER